MHIDYITCPASIADKLASKHSVTVRAARQVLLNEPRIRFAEKGHQEGKDVYAASVQTFGGRYLSIFFIYESETATAVIISAREMSGKERKSYGRK